MQTRITVAAAYILFMVSLLMLIYPASTIAAAKTPVGVWKTVDDKTGKAKSLVRIYSSGGKLYGKVIRLLPGVKYRVCKNCSGRLKNKSIVGMVIIRNLKGSGRDWSGGTIFDPTSGKSYSCSISMSSNGRVLNVRGYVGISLLGRSQRWYRVK